MDSGSNNDNNNQQNGIAIAALCISLVAFMVAVGQFLQQVFSTAEGYRRCQSQVIHHWADKTRLHWRWTQFRFEVKFTTPHIVLDQVVPDTKPMMLQLPRIATNARMKSVPLDHTGRVIRDTPSSQSESPTDLVGWISFLHALECLQSVTCDEFRNRHKANQDSQALIRGAAMVPQDWSWDFMPPEVVRPLATISLGHLVILAHRLGMTWQDIRPGDSILRADGNGQSITSTVFRGLGLVIQYTCEPGVFEPSLSRRSFLRIPTVAVDKLSCGIIPGYHALSVPDIPFLFTADSGKSSGMSSGVSALVAFGFARDTARDITTDGRASYCLCDLLYMCTPFLPEPGSDIVEIFNPFGGGFIGFIASREARLVLRVRLNSYYESKQTKSEQLTAVHDLWNDFFKTQFHHFVNSRSYSADKHSYYTSQELEYVRDIWYKTTDYFVSMNYKHGSRFYVDLIISHISTASTCWLDAVQSGYPRDDQSIVVGPRAGGFVEACHFYVDRIDQVCDKMAAKGYDNRDEITDAWWTLMLRAVVLAAPMRMLPESRYPAVPAQFYGSRTPVYIT